MSKHPNDLPPYPFPPGTMVSGHYDGATFAGPVQECPGPHAIVVRGRRVCTQAVTSYETPEAAEPFDYVAGEEDTEPGFDYEP